LSPQSCAVLALAVLFFSIDYEKDKSPMLFSGNDQENRFSANLRTVLDNLGIEEKPQMGCNIDDIGTH
jgi:hypothetical protein